MGHTGGLEFLFILRVDGGRFLADELGFLNGEFLFGYVRGEAGGKWVVGGDVSFALSSISRPFSMASCLMNAVIFFNSYFHIALMPVLGIGSLGERMGSCTCDT